jgi:hypothetical protein
MRSSPGVAAAVLWLIAATTSAAHSVTLTGVAGQSVTVGALDLKAMPHRTVTVSEHGRAAAYSGVPVTLLLAKVGAPRGDSLRGAAMVLAVAVTGADGYRVVLTLPDTDPAFRDEAAILADSADGRILDSRLGPLRLIVEGDKRPARWVRGVTSLAIVAVP